MERLCQCTVCFEPFESHRKPKVLPCGHTLCEVCIEELLRRGDLQCSDCSQIFSAEQAKQLPTNFAILSENEGKIRASVATVIAAIQCNLCENAVHGTRYICLQCPNFDLCADCFAQKRHRLPGHQLLLNPHSEKVNPSFRGLNCGDCRAPLSKQCFKCLRCPLFQCRDCRTSAPHPHPMEIVTNDEFAE